MKKPDPRWRESEYMRGTWSKRECLAGWSTHFMPGLREGHSSRHAVPGSLPPSEWYGSVFGTRHHRTSWNSSSSINETYPCNFFEPDTQSNACKRDGGSKKRDGGAMFEASGATKLEDGTVHPLPGEPNLSSEVAFGGEKPGLQWHNSTKGFQQCIRIL